MKRQREDDMGNQFTSVDAEHELWFPTVVGRSETEFAALSDEERTRDFFYRDASGLVRLKRGGGKKPHEYDLYCGRLHCVALGDLMGEVFFEKAPSRLIFTTRADSNAQSIRLVDVGYAQSLAENRGVLFQVASNHNAVEGISEMSSVQDKNFVTDYIYDKTQGPAASISAGAAAVARVYAAFEDDGMFKRQTNARQINFLEALNDFCTVKNGYAVLKKNSEAWEAANKTELLKKVQVAIHEHVQVTFGMRKQFVYAAVNDSSHQIIHQIFGAAVNVGQGISGVENRNLPHARSFAHFVLEAMYTATMLTAHKLKCKKVFLTLLGGGVFGNNQEDILSALCQAVRDYGSGLEVHVTMFTITPFTHDVEDLLTNLLQDIDWEYRIVTKGVAETVYPK